jgi:hypothetical protein
MPDFINDSVTITKAKFYPKIVKFMGRGTSFGNECF